MCEQGFIPLDLLQTPNTITSDISHLVDVDVDFVVVSVDTFGSDLLVHLDEFWGVGLVSAGQGECDHTHSAVLVLLPPTRYVSY